ncbi:senescence associated gene 20 [Macadamia integrifolia]|uniref:senescence associated gene 20 n=1 Tax=Macadamia integrifolia TaxID=60698 RepID=UPI001C52EE2F|nr:senescence associated gene 20 [Macadamia integrifolia]
MANDNGMEDQVLEPLELPEIRNKAVVKELYGALKRGDTSTVARLVASDLEWWFHGPPRCQHMMRVLTGKCISSEFSFQPRSVTGIEDDRVIVEGWEGVQVYWVHVWTLQDGVITQFREYFNTWLTVKDLRPSSSASSPRCEIAEVVKNDGLTTLWQSQLGDQKNRSLPGLVLAI